MPAEAVEKPIGEQGGQEEEQADRLAVIHRNLLQHALINEVLGEDAPQEDKLDFLGKYGKEISVLIDHHEHDKIRNLAIDGEYKEAAELLKKVLEEKHKVL